MTTRFMVVAVAVAVGCVCMANGAACTRAADCSFAGQCVQGSCTCTKGFTGPTCSFMVNGTVPVLSGFRLDDYHVWGSQVLQGEDGMFHMLASIYPASLDFNSHWLLDAQIAHAVAPTPQGPFNMTKIVFSYNTVSPLSNPQPWDRSSMNPKVLPATKADGGGFLLIYTGDTYTGPTPNTSIPNPVNQSYWDIQASQRVGIAHSATIDGPYTRLASGPVLSPRPGMWDNRITTNAAVTHLANGSGYLMVYKGSNTQDGKQDQVCLGLATAQRFSGPWTRVVSDPILPCPPNSFDFEDPALYYDPANKVYRLIVKDFDGTVTHAGYSGAHAVSTDGVNFAFVADPLVYTTTHEWSDGKTRHQIRQERPQPLLAADGSGTILGAYYATDTELDGSTSKTWNMWVPAAFQGE